MSTLISTRRALLALALVALSGSDGRCGGGGPTEPVDPRDPQLLMIGDLGRSTLGNRSVVWEFVGVGSPESDKV